MIEDIIEDPLHHTIIETIENLECSHEYSIDSDHIFSLDLPQEETITEIDTYEEIERIIKEYEVSLNTQQDSKYRNIHDNQVEEFLEETLFGDMIENHPHITLTENNKDWSKL